MNKCYFVIALNGNKEGQMVGAYCADHKLGKMASKDQERALLYNYSSPTTSLMDAWLEGTYHNMRVFNRAEARQVARELNSGQHGRSFFYWVVREVGESARKIKEKPIGWRVMVNFGGGWELSSLNVADAGAHVLVDHRPLFPSADSRWAMRLFRTRAEARRQCWSNIAGITYRAVPVYASELCYRVEYMAAPGYALTRAEWINAAVTDINGDTYAKGKRRAFASVGVAETILNNIEQRHRNKYRIVVDWRYNA